MLDVQAEQAGIHAVRNEWLTRASPRSVLWICNPDVGWSTCAKGPGAGPCGWADCARGWTHWERRRSSSWAKT